MKNIKKLIESEKSVQEIFEVLSEAKSKPGNVPVEGDYIRILEDIDGFVQGDICLIKSITDTSEQKNFDYFTLSLESKDGKTGSVKFDKADMDKKFELVYER